LTQAKLTGGAYQARSVIANAQRCINLYPEKNEEDSPFPYTYYPTPRLKLLGTAPVKGAGRGVYRASTGDLYAVSGNTVYFVSSSWVFTALGTIAPNTTPVSMSDNGTTLVLVDGTTSGYQINLATRAFSQIVDPTGFFVGADKVDFLDTFFVFNKPGTPQFYLSLSNSVTFNALDFANKTGAADNVASIAVAHRELWVIGTDTSELWYDAGAADFAFQAMPGSFVEQGCIAKYSVAKYDTAIYWLSQNKAGGRMVLVGEGYSAKRISTHAIEEQLRKMPVVTDAIGFTYQLGGHAYYQLNFPSADQTWVYDRATELWHQRTWTDTNGIQHRDRANCAAYAYGVNVCLDQDNGNLYALDADTYQDNGGPVTFLRSWPHMLDNADRVSYQTFIAEFDAGTDTGSLDGSTPTNPPICSLRFSDDGGHTWSNAQVQSMGAAGQYKTSVQFQRLGMARDRVFELSWSAPAPTALNGAYIEFKKSRE
jgi:hypothetical protein